jgi:glutathione S-transferase
MKKIDDDLHAACSALTFAVAFRPVMLRMTSAQLEAHLQRIPNPAYRERQRLSIAHGLDAPHVADAIRSHDKFLGEMEATLARSAYLAGDDYSLADAAATPYVNRAAMLGMQDLWANRPKVAGWFERMQERASFARAITAWLTDADRERFAAPAGEARRKLRAILNPP